MNIKIIELIPIAIGTQSDDYFNANCPPDADRHVNLNKSKYKHMKNLIPFCIAVLISIALPAQKVPLKSILEHFTNTKCSVCASRNPGLISNINKFPSLSYISIHPSAPYSGCILSLQNTSTNDQRTNFYGVYGSTPRIVINAKAIVNSIDYSDSNVLKPYLNLQSSFDIKMKITRIKTDSMTYQIAIYKVDTSSLDSANLFSGNIEDTVFVNGGNGEARHYHVLRYGVQEILKLPSNMNDSIVIKKSVKLNSIWDEKRISSFAILQSISSNLLIQTGMTGLLPKFSSGSSSIQLSTNSTKISVYPNPANSYLVVNSEEPLNYLIFDIQGVLKLKGRLELNERINIQSLVDGFYILKVEGGKSEDIKFLVHN